MMGWAIDFEDYQVNERGRDEFEVKHRIARYFQYFDELSKGSTSGVAYVLGRDDNFKHLVFDLLFEGKFKNWRQIRELKVVYDNEEAREGFEGARKEPDPTTAQDDLDNIILAAKSDLPKMRTVGARLGLTHS